MRKLKIGNVELATPYILAPMAGVTDLPFRLLCKEQGCGMLYSEMVSAKALHYITGDLTAVEVLFIIRIHILVETAGRDGVTA